MKRMERGRRGQGIVEYVVIVGLIGILLVGVVQVFGSKVGGAYQGVTGGIEDVADEIDTFAGTPEGWRGEDGNASAPVPAPTPVRCRHRDVDPQTHLCRSCGRRVG
jgi:Flp pilus assembly pilin Flp